MSDEFKSFSPPDGRQDRRPLLLAERLAANSSTSIPLACHGWAEVQAAYRFVTTVSVGSWQIMEPRVRCTVQRMAAQPVAMCPQATTTLDFCSMRTRLRQRTP